MLRRSFRLARRLPATFPARPSVSVPALRLSTTTSHAMTKSSSSFQDALKLSPHFDHLDATARPTGYSALDKTVGQHKYAVLETPIEKSPNDDRGYRMVRLENGLEALLVSDPKTDKAAASLCVRVGHLSDPVELQGLAHFCEHLLFMGTEKYPRENEYGEFLTANSGMSNAFTGLDETNYHFDVHPSALDGALDRFAQFFISPLFDESCTEREIQAVDSENKKNLQSDMWRMFQLEKSLSSKQHAYWKFGTGNMDSLWTEPRKNGLEPRSELLKFHQQYYSANLFKLAIVGSNSLDELTEMVVSKFSPAENKNLPPPLFAGSPFTSEQLKQHTFVKTLKDVRLLELTFPGPDPDISFASKPAHFLSHYVGHEGPGSILSFLKQKGWANSLAAGMSGTGTGSGLFKVNVDLTKEGLERHSDVAAVVFHYIRLLKATPPQEWAFKEISMLNEIAFRFQEPTQPMSYATTLSAWLHKPHPRSQVLSAPVLTSEFQRDQIAGVLSSLDVDNCRATVASQDQLDGLQYDAQEKWYGTQYTVKEFGQKLLDTAANSTSEGLSLPGPNQFMPTNLDIIDKVETDQPAKKPALLEDKPDIRIWHKKDDRWWVPKATTMISIRSPFISGTPAQSILSRLYTDLVEDSLSEFSYDADLAGLSYELFAQLGTITLTLEGYNDKLASLQEVVVDKMTNFEVDPQRFNLLKDKLRQGLENYKLANPYQHAIFHLTHLTLSELFEPEQQLEALLNVSAEDLQTHIKGIFSRSYVEALAHGNILGEDTVKMATHTAKSLKAGSLSAEEKQRTRGLIPPPGSHCFRAPVQDPGQLNSAVDLLLYFGKDSDQDLRTRNSLLVQLASDHCFDVLRTKEQLGYIAQCMPKHGAGLLGFHVIVQSERDADYVDSRVENWFNELRSFIAGLSADDFAQHRESVVNRKLEDHKNMAQETGHYWAHIANGYYDFERKHADAEKVKTLTQEDMLAFFDQYVSASAPNRSKLTVHIRSQRLNADAASKLKAAVTSAGLSISSELDTQLSENPTFEQTAALLKETYSSSQALSSLLEQLEQIRWPALPEGTKEVDKSLRKELALGPVAAPVQPLSAT